MGTQAASTGLWGAPLRRFHSLPSTNQWLLENAGACAHGEVVRACRQTAGRGRFQRAWLAPEDRGLTFSVLFGRAEADDWMHPVIGQAAALAVQAVLEHHAIPALLKWPNDVLVRGKKIAGILAEKTQDGRGVVLGIGLNVNLEEADFTGLPLLQPATSMRIETGQTHDIEAVFASLLESLQTTLDMAMRHGMGYLLQHWRAHDALSGRSISVHTVDGPISGLYAGLDGEGRLCLEDDAGQKHAFWSGDVSLREQGPI